MRVSTPTNRLNTERARAIGIVTIALMLIVSSFGVAPAGATTETLSITTNTVLTEDHDGNIEIDADNVMLNCARHSVTGSNGDFGILLNGRTGVTVKNCDVTGFHAGIQLIDSSGNTIQHNTTNNMMEGIGLSNSGYNLLTHNVANENGYDGFLLQSSHHNTLVGNTAEGNIVGFSLEGADHNTFTRNVAMNGGFGFSLSGASSNVFERNVAISNAEDGFVVEDFEFSGLPSFGSQFVRNVSNSNVGFGYVDVTEGAGTAGTANTYNMNVCWGNGGGGSFPHGLC